MSLFLEVRGAALLAKRCAYPGGEKPWMKHFGVLSKLRKENRRIEKIIEKEFEAVNAEEWR